MSLKHILKLAGFLLLIFCIIEQTPLFHSESFAQNTSEKALSLLKEGNTFYRIGNYKEAAGKYHQAWETKKLPEACYNLAATLDVELNKNKESQIYYRKYSSLDVEEEDIENISELIDKAKNDAIKEVRWKALKEKESAALIQSLVKEVKKLQNIKYDDSTIKEMLNEEGKLFKGLASVCLGCHATFMGPMINMKQTHPVGRIPKGALAETVPENVRFYKEGRVICMSCHDPKTIHSKSKTEGKTYKVLRVDTGKKGENMSLFCAFCHIKKSSSKYLEDGIQPTKRRRRSR